MSAEDTEVTGVAEHPPSLPPPIRVTVTDVDVSFGSLVWLLVKFTFALIPAAIIIALIVYLIATFIRASAS